MSERESHQDAPVRRGAWYPDPYGSAEQQRWYDGTKWTDEVRPTQTGEEPPRVRVSRWEQWFDPPVRIEALVESASASFPAMASLFLATTS
jgi:hypothetical protein